ncbi:hypothetical protein [Tunturiibacter lichenicola]|nr:hypothetical protein [Edaphobacter lichenicola]
MQSGQLTAGGHLTKSDREALHQQQNQKSRRIYRGKQNGKAR